MRHAPIRLLKLYVRYVIMCMMRHQDWVSGRAKMNEACSSTDFIPDHAHKTTVKYLNGDFDAHPPGSSAQIYGSCFLQQRTTTTTTSTSIWSKGQMWSSILAQGASTASRPSPVGTWATTQPPATEKKEESECPRSLFLPQFKTWQSRNAQGCSMYFGFENVWPMGCELKYRAVVLNGRTLIAEFRRRSQITRLNDHK